MANQRQYPRTPMKCRIKISHPDFGDVFGHTRDLSDGGVYVRHEVLAALPAGRGHRPGAGHALRCTDS